MKKILFLTVGLICCLAINPASAQDAAPDKPAKKPAPTAEQKALRKELTEKYDTNKSGRLDRDERAKMSPEDAEKWYSVSPADKERDEAARAKAAEKKAAAEAKKAAAEAKKAEAEAKKAAKTK